MSSEFDEAFDDILQLEEVIVFLEQLKLEEKNNSQSLPSSNPTTGQHIPVLSGRRARSRELRQHLSQPYSIEHCRPSALSQPCSSEPYRPSTQSQPFSSEPFRPSTQSQTYSNEPFQLSTQSQSYRSETFRPSAQSQPYSSEPFRPSTQSQTYSNEPFQPSTQSQPYSSKPYRPSTQSQPYSSDPFLPSTTTRPYNREPFQPSTQSQPYSTEPFRPSTQSQPYSREPFRPCTQSQPYSSEPFRPSTQSQPYRDEPYRSRSLLRGETLLPCNEPNTPILQRPSNRFVQNQPRWCSIRPANQSAQSISPQRTYRSSSVAKPYSHEPNFPNQSTLPTYPDFHKQSSSFPNQSSRGVSLSSPHSTMSASVRVPPYPFPKTNRTASNTVLQNNSSSFNSTEDHIFSQFSCNSLPAEQSVQIPHNALLYNETTPNEYRDLSQDALQQSSSPSVQVPNHQSRLNYDITSSGNQGFPCQFVPDSFQNYPNPTTTTNDHVEFPYPKFQRYSPLTNQRAQVQQFPFQNSSATPNQSVQSQSYEYNFPPPNIIEREFYHNTQSANQSVQFQTSQGFLDTASSNITVINDFRQLSQNAQSADHHCEFPASRCLLCESIYANDSVQAFPNTTAFTRRRVRNQTTREIICVSVETNERLI